MLRLFRTGCCWVLTLFPCLGNTTNDFHELRERALEALGSGSFHEAEALMKSAIAGLGAGEASAEGVTFWNESGVIHEAQANLDLAEKEFQHALELNRGLAQPNRTDEAATMNNLAEVLRLQGKALEASALLEQAYAIGQREQIMDTAVGRSLLINHGAILQKQGRTLEAQAAYAQAETSFHQHGAEKSVEFARLIAKKGVLSSEVGRLPEAIQSDKQVLSIFDTLPFVAPSERAEALNNLAWAFTESGAFAEARPLFLKAIELQRSEPRLKARLINSLNNLSVMEEKAGRAEEAERREREAESLARTTLAERDPLWASIWNNLGLLAVARGNFREAQQSYEKAAQLWRNTSGETSPSYAATLSNMASLESRRGHLKKARGLLSRVLEIDEAKLGANHPHVASDLINLAAQYFQEKNVDEAIRLLERAQAIQEVAIGKANPVIARTRHNLGVAYQAAKRFEDAENAYEAALRDYQSSAIAHAEEVTSCFRQYAMLLRVMKRYGEAEQAEVRATRAQVETAIEAEKARAAIPGAQSFRGNP